MNQKTFPYQGWVLLPSFRPVERTFVSKGAWAMELHKSEEGKLFNVKDIYEYKEDAIAAGHADLDRQQSALDKRQVALEKRRAALEKAAEQ